MKIYFAARYSRHEEMRKYRDIVHAAGFPEKEVTSRWIDAHGGKHLVSLTPEEIGADTRYARIVAHTDIDDIIRARMLVAFTDGDNATSKGGRHVGWGYAYARGKILVAIGPYENIFYSLATYHYSTWDEFWAEWSDRL